MHVLFVTPTFPPDNGWGGIGTYVYHAARGLTQLGHRVTVLCGVGEREYETTEGAVTVVRRINMQLRGRTRLEHIASLVHQLVADREVDVVEFGEYGADGLVYQQAYPSTPTIVRLHGASRLCVLGDDPPWKRLARKVIRSAALDDADRSERESVKRAHVVTACSRWTSDTYQRDGWALPDETHVIYNPISSTESPPTSDYASQEILSLGRVSLRKGADLIPAIMGRVWQSIPGAKLRIIGQDLPKGRHHSWTQWIKTQVPPQFRDQLLFSGGVSYAEVLKTLRNHSLAFFASTWETFGYTHVECMQAGIACVIGSVGGAQELGEHGVSALNTPRSAPHIADAIIRLLKDPVLRQQIGNGAQARVMNMFDAVVVARELERVYVRAIDVAGACIK